MTTGRLPIVGVMGSSDAHVERLARTDPSAPNRIRNSAVQLGEFLGRQPLNLLTGGGGGAMRAVCQGFASIPDRGGKIVGVIPGPAPRTGYPNEFVEILIQTHLPGHDPLAETSRNHINVLSSDAIIALPGGPGTSAEIQLALKYNRPVCTFLSEADLVGEKTGEELAKEGIPCFSNLDQLSDWLASKLSCQADVQEG